MFGQEFEAGVQRSGFEDGPDIRCAGKERKNCAGEKLAELVTCRSSQFVVAVDQVEGVLHRVGESVVQGVDGDVAESGEDVAEVGDRVADDVGGIGCGGRSGLGCLARISGSDNRPFPFRRRHGSPVLQQALRVLLVDGEVVVVLDALGLSPCRRLIP